MRRCGECRWYAPGNNGMECTNERLGEHAYEDDGNYLSYPYDEGGTFLPGPNFGCINYKKKVKRKVRE